MADEFNNSSQIGEDVGSFPDADTMLRNLLSDHETITRHIVTISRNQELNDEGTYNFLTDKMEEHEKIANSQTQTLASCISFLFPLEFGSK